MTTEKKLAAIVVDTLVRLGVKHGHEGLRDALKDAVWEIHDWKNSSPTAAIG